MHMIKLLRLAEAVQKHLHNYCINYACTRQDDDNGAIYTAVGPMVPHGSYTDIIMNVLVVFYAVNS